MKGAFLLSFAPLCRWGLPHCTLLQCSVEHCTRSGLSPPSYPPPPHTHTSPTWCCCRPLRRAPSLPPTPSSPSPGTTLWRLLARRGLQPSCTRAAACGMLTPSSAATSTAWCCSPPACGTSSTELGAGACKPWTPCGSPAPCTAHAVCSRAVLSCCPHALTPNPPALLC